MFFAGGCAECHAKPLAKCKDTKTEDPTRLGGGRCLKTDFGVFHVPNISPDKETGIGTWTTLDFVNAMKRGIGPDGTHLYPAFPYASYQRMTKEDLIDLKAYLDTLPAVQNEVPPHQLTFPYNIRRGVGLWQLLYIDGRTFKPDPQKSVELNRGAYLVEGLGHCGACHSPRNELGAEIATRYLAGGFAEGWEAPALTSLSRAPIPWNEDELYAYLRNGESRFHGVAAGPMAPVVRELKALPDRDIRAMAVYLASFNEGALDRQAAEALAARLESATLSISAASPGARIYQGACAVCHEVGGPALFGSRPSLSLNSNVHSDVPDNLIQVILHGIAAPVSPDLGYMPAFRESLSDRQLAELIGYIRRQFAPGKPAWTGIDAAISRLRSASVH